MFIALVIFLWGQFKGDEKHMTKFTEGALMFLFSISLISAIFCDIGLSGFLIRLLR